MPLPVATPSEEPAETTGKTIVHVRARWLAPAVILCVDLAVLLVAADVAGRAPLALAYVGVALIVLAASRSYRVSITPRALDETPWLVAHLGVALVLLTPVGLLTGETDALLRGAVL